MKEEITVD